ncbi:MAG: thiamine-phosphate kinase [Phenylobacterium sp.]|uniref:thiamine-phosphate kinase n=1 Tax=Phenylobacterium sp. TaxID=1871053 RepID=UPI00271E1805|nr:thiamine-phosphate kinase [Phenylobacterium sp.]MDO9430699.1 thiamine-phosphate kinase [Phenylobacterium sp.]
MSAPEAPQAGGPDEFGQIARLFRPLTNGAPEALGLLDDAAAIPSRPGFDLIVTKDAMVEGVHFLPGEAPGLIARKLLRVNLSDLAAKGAEPYGYFLATAWTPGFGWNERQAFAEGLRVDGAAYGLTLLGGDTVSTPGPLTLSLTMLGWTPNGAMIRRGGAQAGDLICVSGVIGDGWLGLKAARGELADPGGYLAGRYRLPSPRVELREALRAHASAAADISDGLIADAGHIGEASGLAVRLELDRLPLSTAARAWLDAQDDRAGALRDLASGGDDYEIVCTVRPGAAARALGLTVIGSVAEGAGISVTVDGGDIAPGPGGWKHPL